MANNKLNFTKRALEDLPLPPDGKRVYYNDTKIKGLQLAVTSAGKKSFVVYRRIEGRPTRTLIGHFPDLALERARTQAEVLIGKIASGVDPKAEKQDKQARRITLNTCFTDFINAKTQRLKPKTLYDYKRLWEVAFGDWHTRRLTEIHKNTVLNRHQQLSTQRGKAYADLAMRLLQGLFNFAIHTYEDSKGEPLLRDNPVTVLSRAKAWNRISRRETYLKEHILPAWFACLQEFKAAENDPMGAIVADYLQVLLFTGLRRSEAARLKWSDVDFADRTLKITDTKNHETHVLPLGNYLLSLLRIRKENTVTGTEYVFPGNGKSRYVNDPRKHIKQLVNVTGVPFTLHDLRRTFATYAAHNGITGYALKDLLNHKMGHDVTAGYIIFNVERLREPMQKIENYILSAANLKSDNIIQLSEHQQA